MTDLEGMNRNQLLVQIIRLRGENERLNKKVSDLTWDLYPDRSGGQFDSRDNFYDEWRNSK